MQPKCNDVKVSTPLRNKTKANNWFAVVFQGIQFRARFDSLQFSRMGGFNKLAKQPVPTPTHFSAIKS